MNRLLATAAVMVFGISAALAQSPAAKAPIEQAEKLMSSGDVAGAIAALQPIVASSPSSFHGRLALGRALDLQGRHEDARVHLEEALKLAAGDQRTAALTALGVSYAFEAKADEAARYYQRAFDADIQADARAAAAGRANALGRIYLESGSLQKAEQWYTTGYEMAKKIPELPAPQAALWEMRWHNALGRIEARRSNLQGAQEHANAVKGLLDRTGADNQRVFYPYLIGYIAFFNKAYRSAAEELAKGDQSDPFVLGLIAQSYEKLGDRARAEEYYRKVMAAATHSINSAFSRPQARTFLLR